MTDVAKLRHHRELGVRLLIDFIRATPETAAGIVKRERAWMRDLIPLVERFGHGAAARFEPLTPMHLHEQLSVAQCAPLDDTANMARIEHVVRMSRLDELFQKFAPALPKGKGGNRRTINDDPIVDEVRAYLKSSGTKNKAAAVREVAKRFPHLFHGDGDPSNIVKRIVRKLNLESNGIYH